MEEKRLYNCFGSITGEIRSLYEGSRNVLNSTLLKSVGGLCNALSFLALLGLSWSDGVCLAHMKVFLASKWPQIPKGVLKILRIIVSPNIVCRSEPCVVVRALVQRKGLLLWGTC